MRNDPLAGPVLVTGGAGFIGSALCHHLAGQGRDDLHVVDALTYAANRASIAPLEASGQIRLHSADICDARAMTEIFTTIRPKIIFHLAAESHVDRSIDGAAVFVQTNVNGTFSLLEAARQLFGTLDADHRARFRFIHVSTDEVYGALERKGRFTEASPYAPNSPYAASKAASDHLARAWHRTHGLPVIVTNCSNNYGPRQFPEKLIPLMILKALADEPLPVYGNGMQVRDWLHVEDHARALMLAALRGQPGETYLIGGEGESTNLAIVEAICDLMDVARPQAAPHRQLITHVADRPGHDLRYAIDASKIRRELGWKPTTDFARGLAETVDWYLANEHWWRPMLEGTYRGQRLGLGDRPA